jgi:hypothetical protein
VIPNGFILKCGAGKKGLWQEKVGCPGRIFLSLDILRRRVVRSLMTIHGTSTWSCARLIIARSRRHRELLPPVQ